MEKIRLQKFLSAAGVCSRRQAEKYIMQKKITINDQIAILGDKIDPYRDQIFVDGKQIKSVENCIYYAVNKPVGYTSSVRDINAEKLVTDLVPKQPKVWPVGRLDKNSCGLIILTNDGELTNQLTHPRYEHQKEYQIKIQISNNKSQTLPTGLRLRPFDFCSGRSEYIEERGSDSRSKQVNPKFQIQKLKNPIKLTEGWARFDKLDIIEINDKRNTATIKVVLHQGWKRQIRRMCEKVGLYVIELKRTRIAKLELGDLKEGEYRLVKKDDITKISNLVK